MYIFPVLKFAKLFYGFGLLFFFLLLLVLVCVKAGSHRIAKQRWKFLDHTYHNVSKIYQPAFVQCTK